MMRNHVRFFFFFLVLILLLTSYFTEKVIILAQFIYCTLLIFTFFKQWISLTKFPICTKLTYLHGFISAVPFGAQKFMLNSGAKLCDQNFHLHSMSPTDMICSGKYDNAECYKPTNHKLPRRQDHSLWGKKYTSILTKALVISKVYPLF